MAAEAKADTIFADSLKDAALNLSDDKVGGAVNRAIQTALAGGRQICANHHQRKNGADGNKPRRLEDVYGSAWITAGAGSVVLLWGDAGAPIVDLNHLKQPAAEVGPLQVEHDHIAGRSSVVRGQVDTLTVLTNSTRGLTAVDLARIMHPNANETTNAMRVKAKRKLDALVAKGKATKAPGGNTSSGHSEDRYHAVMWP
jgi:replicative DNA helicase